jgi:hypothetical protein
MKDKLNLEGIMQVTILTIATFYELHGPKEI